MESQEGWGGPLWNSMQSEKAAPTRQASRGGGMGRRDSRGAQKSSRTSLGSSTSCSLHPEPWEEIAQNAMGTGMGGGAAKSIWDSLQKEKQGPSLPRQESRRSLQKQGSRKEVTEPFKDRTNWKDSLRDKNKNQQGTTDDHEAKKYEARRSMSTRSFSSSIGREEDINTPFRSPSPPRTGRHGTSSPSRSSCSSPTRVTDIASIEEDLANLRSQVGDGGSPLGDYVSFDKFRAGRSNEGPSELGIESSAKLAAWRNSRSTAERASSDFGTKSKTSNEFTGTSSNLGKTSYNFEKTSSSFRNPSLDQEKSSDSDDWTSSSRGRAMVGKADSSYGSWTGGSPARDSSTSPKSSFSSSSNSLGARVGLSTLKAPTAGSWINKRD